MSPIPILDDDTYEGFPLKDCPVLANFVIGNELGVTIVGAISTSLFLYLFYLFFYVRAPILRRHPTSIAIYKCVFEFILVQQYIWTPYLTYQQIYQPVNGCKSNDFIAFWSFVSQFSALGSELTLFVVTYALYVAHKNPFTSFKYYKPYFIFLVLGFPFAASVIVSSSGSEIYGISNEGNLWIQDRSWHGDGGKVKGGVINGYYKFVFLYLWIFLVYVYSIFAIWSLRGLKDSGLDITLKNRRAIILRSQRYVWGYMIYWTVLMACQFTVFIKKDPYYEGIDTIPIDCSQDFYASTLHCIVGTIVVYMYAIRGIWGFGVIVYINWSDLKENNWRALRELSSTNSTLNVKALQEIEELKRAEPHLNEALRAEVVLVTTQGIMFAARHQERIRQLANVDEVDHTTDFQAMLRESLCAPSEGSLHAQEVITPMQGTNKDTLLRPSLSSSLADDYNQIRLSQSRAVDALLKEENDKAYQDLITKSRKRANSFVQRQTEIFQVASPSKGSASNEVSFEMRETNGVPSNRIQSRASIDPSENPFKNIFGGTQSDDFSFRDYCPQLFAKVRSLQGVSAEDFANSFKTQCKLSFSEGRSGAFLFFSGDERFVCKTTSKSECDKLKEILPDFIKYLEANPGTLICPFYGCHCITMYNVSIYFTVMQNAFPVESIRLIDERYDLKGSWVNRTGKKKMTRKSMSTKAANKTELAPLYQDNELLHTIILPQERALALKDQILRDTAFLADLNLMDYSLLVGVHRERFNLRESEISADGGNQVCAVEGPGRYYFRIIDILQEWNLKKKFERYFKIFFKRYDPEGISAIEPRAYQERFMRNVVYDVFDGVDDDQEWMRKFRASTNTPGDDYSEDGSSREMSSSEKSVRSELTVDNMIAFSRRSIHFGSTTSSFRGSV